MKIKEITLPQDIPNAATQLKSGGYKGIETEPGHDFGSYSGVFYRNDRPYVLKLFTAEDKPYLSYLNLINTVSNPHFPVVRGKPMQVNPTYFAVRLERLTPLTGDGRMWTSWAELLLQSLQRNDRKHAAYAMESLPDTLAQAIRLIYDRCVKGRNVLVDLTKNNAMMRGDTVVITDPIAPLERSSI